MSHFFGDDLLLYSKEAASVYAEIRSLPIIDYHCHLDICKIASHASFSDIGELWLSGDHYKWRAMRMCGIDEKYITGDAPYKEKFLRYAKIMPLLAGNPLYYWTHMELSQIFGIHLPLCEENAERIYEKANEKLKSMTVSSLLEKFDVEYIATTDDPIDDLALHGRYGNTLVCPTFRPDKLYAFDDDYLGALGRAAGITLSTLDDLLFAIQNRLDFFVSRGCRISDHGFERFPKHYASKEEAVSLFARRHSLSPEEKDALFGFLLVWLAKEYAKRGMLMQLHFSVIRNQNPAMFEKVGPDTGFDLIGEEQSVKDAVRFFAEIRDEERPETVLYTLNDTNLPALACITGAFRKVRMGAAWWFNDTVEGIRKNLSVIAEYSALGTNLGMLTDSRSFSSYVRFDFFRRLLANDLGELIKKGEYDLPSAVYTAKRICYGNIKDILT